MDGAIEVEIVAERNPDSYGFTVKALANGRLHRVIPARDPSQPRFWCVVVYRCLAGGLPDASERPWIGPGGLRREDLPAALGEIRADPGAWLATAAQGALRDWMLESPATPLPASTPTIPASALAAE